MPLPAWFPAAFAPMVASQLARLGQSTPSGWVAFDYAGRLGGLAVLAAIPAARRAAFARERLAVGPLEAMVWILALLLTDRFPGEWSKYLVDQALGSTALGHYPDLQGWLYAVDMSFGLWLVAYGEEVVFRRAARAALGPTLGDGHATLVSSALLFAAYHWWTGLGNMTLAFLFGIVAMIAYRRCQALWPVVAGHYLADLVSFA